jgi:hypothetical protein
MMDEKEIEIDSDGNVIFPINASTYEVAKYLYDNFRFDIDEKDN